MALCYLPQYDLGHYGQVDHLAPAGSMQDFVRHVREMNREEAQEAFTPVQDMLQAGKAVLHVAHDIRDWEALLQELAARHESLLLFLPRVQ